RASRHSRPQWSPSRSPSDRRRAPAHLPPPLGHLAARGGAAAFDHQGSGRVSPPLDPSDPQVKGASGATTLLDFLAIFGAHYAFVRPTNFGGMDEWLYIDLGSRGIQGIPYANRPLVLMWSTPAAVL